MNISASFAAFKAAGMTVPASWTPSGGGAVQTADALLDMPDNPILGGMGLSTEYAITYASTDLAGLKGGETISVNSVSYKVREQPKKIDDGALSVALLSKV